VDKFSWTIFIKNLQDNPVVFTMDQFEEKLIQLPIEDIQEIFDALHYSPDDVDTSRHVVKLLQILWHYQ